MTIAAQAEAIGAHHILALPHYYEKTGRRPPGGGDGPVFYYGGSVFSSVKVVTVIWGDNVDPQTMEKIPIFSSDLVNSTYVDQMSEYDTLHHRGVNGHGSTKQHIARGSYLGQAQIAPKHNATQITDRDIQEELSYQIKIGVLPRNDLDTLYMIYFPPNVTIDLNGLISCQDFGAYHFAKNTRRLKNSNLFYSAEPECNAGFDFLTYAASHEFAEAVTDNIPTPGSVPDFPQAWNDVHGHEIGDLCTGFLGTLTDGTNSFEVTQYYLNSTSGCSTGNYQSP
ncbi:MAG: hypothetical protein JOZ13_17500 [Alphaproteobacteria bacterium]|nr:hypothetical protein [Alphaproteobacteria bacterium]